jgi:hypothetical protein
MKNAQVKFCYLPSKAVSLPDEGIYMIEESYIPSGWRRKSSGGTIARYLDRNMVKFMAYRYNDETLDLDLAISEAVLRLDVSQYILLAIMMDGKVHLYIVV